MTTIIDGTGAGTLNSSLFLLSRRDNVGGHIGGTNDAVYFNFATGGLVFQQQDGSLSAQGQDFAQVRTYNSSGQLTANGQAWTFNAALDISQVDQGEQARATLFNADGSEFVFSRDEQGRLVSEDGEGAYWTLTVTGDGTERAFTVTRGDGQRMTFDHQGVLQAIEDPSGNRIEYTYFTTGPHTGKLSGVVDINAAGQQTGKVRYTYHPDSGRLHQVIDDDLTQSVMVTYEWDAQGHLVASTDRDNRTTRFRYGSGDSQDPHAADVLVGIDLPFDNGLINSDLLVYQEWRKKLGFATRLEDLLARPEDVDRLIATASRSIDFEYQTVFKGNGLDQRVLSAIVDGEGNRTEFSYDFDQDAAGNYAGGTTRVTSALGLQRADSNADEDRTWRSDNDYYETYDANNPTHRAQRAEILERFSKTYKFNREGAVTEVTDEKVQNVTYTLGADGQLLANTELASFSTRCQYDDSGNLTHVTSALGDALTRSDAPYYLALRASLGFTNADGSAMSVDQLQATEGAVERLLARYTTVFTYDDRGNRLTSTDGEGRLSEWTYTAFNKVETETSARAWELTTQNTDEARAARQALGFSAEFAGLTAEDKLRLRALFTTHYQYDDDQNLTHIQVDLVRHADNSIAGGGQHTEYTYVEGNLDKEIVYLDPLDPNKTLITDYNYRANGQLDSKTGPDGATTTYTYDQAGNVLTATTHQGTTTYTYDAQNRLLSVSDPQDRITSHVYDSAGNHIAMTDIGGHTVVSIYDRANRLVQTLNPSDRTDHPGDLDRRTQYTYDVNGNNTSVVDAEGRTTTYRYDEANRLVTVKTTEVEGEDGKTPRHYESSYAYDAENRRINVVDNNRQLTQVSYDQRGLVVRSVDAAGSVTEYLHDAVGNRVHIIQGAQLPADEQRHLRLGYDEKNRAVVEYDALGHESSRRYDLAGRLASVTDANQHTTDYQYEYVPGQGLKITEIKPEVADPERPDRQIRYQVVTEYDRAGNVVARTDENRNTTRYAFDKLNRLVMVTDANLINTVYTYDEWDRRTKILIGVQAKMDGDAVEISDVSEAKIETYQYNAFGQLESVVDAHGNALLNSDAALYQQLRVEMQMAQKVADLQPEHRQRILDKYTTRYEYDKVGNRTAMIDHKGVRTEFVFDDLNRMTARVDARHTDLERTTRYTYDGNGNLVSQTTANADLAVGSDDQAWLDFRARLGLVDEKGQGLRAEALTGQKELQDKLRGLFKTTMVYDAVNRLVDTITASAQDALNSQLRVHRELDAFGNLLSETRHVKDAQGLETAYRGPSFEYDLQGRLSKSFNALGEQTAYYIHDGVGNLRVAEHYVYVRAQDTYVPYRTENVYDALNRKVKVKDALTNETRFEYDGVGNLVKIIDPLNNTRSVTYDAGNRQLTSTDGEGKVTTYRYNDRGDRISVMDARGHEAGLRTDLTPDQIALEQARYTTTYTYGANGLLHSAHDESGQTLTSYDENYNVTRVVDGNHHSTGFEFDALNRTILVRDGEQQVTRFAWDANGNRISVTDANLNVTRFDFDHGDRQVVHTDALGNRTRYAYDALNRRTLVTDANQHTTVYAYDDMDRLASVRNGAGNTTTYEYDVNNNRIRVIDANAQHALGSDDELARNLRERCGVYVGSFEELLKPENHAKAEAIRAYFRTEYEYDALNRVIAVRDPLGQVVKTHYDAAGNVDQVTDALGAVTTRYHDKNNRVSLEVDALGFAVAHYYDAVGNRRSSVRHAIPLAMPVDPQVRPVVTASASDSTTTWEHDEQNRVVREVSAEGGVTEFVYDAVGNQTSVRRARDFACTSWTTSSYRYDRNNRVRFVQSGEGHLTELTYDAVGNVRSRTVYDTPTALGTLTPKPGDTRHTTYAFYDAANRETFSVSPGGSVTEVRYDAVGNRLEWIAYANRLTAEPSPEDKVPAVVIDTKRDRSIRMAYDGANQQVWQISAEKRVARYVRDANGQVLEYRSFARPVDTLPPLGQAPQVQADDATDAVFRFVYDAKGRQTHRIGAEGSVVKTIYDAAGQTYQTIHYKLPLVAQAKLGAEPEVTTHAADQVVTRLYYANGRLAWQIDAEGGVQQNVYDAAGNPVRTRAYTMPHQGDVPKPVLVRSQEALLAGVVPVPGKDQESAMYYDREGNQVLTVDAEGGAVYNEYNANRQVVRSTAVRARLNVPPPATLQEALSILPRDARNDAVQCTVYDLDFQAVLHIGANGEATEQMRDALGQVVQTTQYRTRFDSQAALPQAGDTLNSVRARGGLTSSAADAVSRVYYDRDGRAMYTVDAMGGVTGTQRDAFGEVIQTTSYARAWDAAPAAGTAAKEFERLLEEAGVPLASKDQVTTFFHDREGRLCATVDAMGGVTVTRYDALSNRAEQTSYKRPLEGQAPVGRPLEELLARVTVDKQADQTQRWLHDRDGRERVWINAVGTVIRTDFDGRGQLVSTTHYKEPFQGELPFGKAPDDFLADMKVSPGKDQTTHFVRDAMDRIRYMVTPEKMVRAQTYDTFGNAITDTVYAKFHEGLEPALGTTVAEFALAVQASPADQTRYTVYGRTNLARFMVDGERGVTEIRYDTRGLRLESVQYATRLAGALPTERTTTTEMRGRVASLPLIDRTETLVRDQAGRVVLSIDAERAVRESVYDAFGNVVKTITYQGRYGGSNQAPVRPGEADTRESLRLQVPSQLPTFSAATDPVEYRVHDKLGRVRYTLDAERNLHGAVYDSTGNVVRSQRYLLPYAGQVPTDLTDAKTFETWVGTAAAETQGMAYDRRNRQVLSVDAAGSAVSYVYDAQDNLVEERRHATAGTLGKYQVDQAWGGLGAPAASEHDLQVSRVYDRANRLAVHIGAWGDTTVYDRDAQGNVTQATRLALRFSGARPHATTAREDLGLQSHAKDQVTTTWFNRNNQAVLVVDPGLSVRQYRYNVQGQAYEEVAYANRVMARNGQLPTFDAARDQKVSRVFDRNGRCVLTADGAGQVTLSRFDALGNEFATSRLKARLADADRPVTDTDPQKLIDKLAAAPDAKPAQDQTFSRVFDRLGQVVLTVDAERGVRKYAYDARGNLSYERGLATRFALDKPLPGEKASLLLGIQGLPTESGLDSETNRLYGLNNRLRLVIDPAYAATRFDHDSAGNVVTVHRYHNAYSQAPARPPVGAVYSGSLLPRTHRDDQVETTVYQAGRVIGRIDGEGSLVTYTWDALGQLVSERAWTNAFVGKRPGLDVPVFNLPPENSLEDRVTTHLYDHGQKTAIIRSDRTVTSYEHDAFGNLVRQTDYANRFNREVALPGAYASFTVDMPGMQVDAVNDQSIHKVYDASNQCVLKVDAGRNVSTMRYDGRGNVVETRVYWGAYDEKAALPDQFSQVREVDEQLQFDNLPGMPAANDARDAVSNLVYDRNDRVIFSVDAMGSAMRTDWDVFGNAGATYAFALRYTGPRDALRYGEVYPPAVHTDDQKTVHLYNRRNERVYTVNAEGYAVGQRFDAFGNVEMRIDYVAKDPIAWKVGDAPPPINNTPNGDRNTHFKYYRNNQLAQQWTVNGSGIANGTPNMYQVFEYDMLGRLTRKTQDYYGTEKHIESFSYDRANQLLTSTDAAENVTTFRYNAFHERVETTNANYAAASKFDDLVAGSGDGYYRRMRRLLGIDKSASALTSADFAVLRAATTETYTRDQAGRVVRTTGPLRSRLNDDGSVVTLPGVATEVVYDAFGNRRMVIEALGLAQEERRTEYQYDQLNRVKLVTDALRGETRFDYDHFDRQVVTDARGHAEVREFDKLGRLLRSERAGVEQVYDLDAFGRQKSVTQRFTSAQGALGVDARTHSFEYDRLNRRILETNGEGFSTQSTFDAFNLRKIEQGLYLGADNNKKNLEFRIKREFTYDNDNRLISEIDGLGSETLREYDRLGREIAVTQANNTPVGDNGLVTQARKTRTQYTLNDLVKRVEDAEGGVTSFGYDAVGNLAVKGQLRDTFGATNLAERSYIVPKEATWASLAQTLYGSPALGAQLQKTLGLAEVPKAGDVLSNLPASLDTVTMVTIQVPAYPYYEVKAGDTWSSIVAKLYPDASGPNEREAIVALLRQQYGCNEPTAGQRLTSFPDPVDIGFGKGPFTLNAQALSTSTSMQVPVVQSHGLKLAERWTYTHYEYDSQRRVTAVIDPYAVRTESRYDAVGNRTEQASGVVRNAALVVDARDRRIVKSEYDLLNRVTASIDAEQHRTEYRYDAVGNLVRVRDALGGITRYYVDAANRVTDVLDAEGYMTTVQYDAAGNRTLQRVWMSRATASPQDDYYDTHKPEVGASGDDRETLFQYNRNSLLTKQTERTSSPLDRMKSTVNITEHEYNGANLLITNTLYAQLKDKKGERTQTFTYNARGQQKTVVDVDRSKTTLGYDGAGNVVWRRIDSPPASAITDTTGLEWDPVRIRLSLMSYDLCNRQRSEIIMDTADMAAGKALSIRTMSHDRVGNLTSTATWIGDRAAYRSQEYDWNGLLLKTWDETGRTVVNEYDRVHNLIAQTDGRQFRTEFEYNRNNQQTKVIRPWADSYSVAQGLYDADADPERLLRRPTTTMDYDALGRVRQVVDPEGSTVTYYYDRKGNKVAMRRSANDKGDVFSEYDYNAQGQVVVQRDFEVFVTGPTTNRPQVEDSWARRTTEYLYDCVGRLVQKTLPRVDVTANYSDGGQTSSVRPTEVHIYNEYGDEVSTQDRMLGLAVSFYNVNHQVIRRVGVDGALTMYDYDATGQVIKQSVYVDKVTPYRLSSTRYDRPDTRTVFDEPVPLEGAERYQTLRYYNSAGQLVRELGPEVHPYEAQHAQRQVTILEYDDAGRVFSKTVTAMEVPSGKLGIYPRKEYFFYDDAGRLQAQLDANRVLTVYEHDGNGNTRLMSKYHGQVDLEPVRNVTTLAELRKSLNQAGWGPESIEIEYVYDAGNRLTSETNRGNIGVAGDDLTTEHRYDRAGRRTWSRTPDDFVTANAYNADGTVRTTITQVRGMHHTATVLEYDAAGNMVKAYNGVSAIRTAYDGFITGVAERALVTDATLDQNLIVHWTTQSVSTTSWVVYGQTSHATLTGGSPQEVQDAIEQLYAGATTPHTGGTSNEAGQLAHSATLSDPLTQQPYQAGAQVYYRVLTMDMAGNLSWTAEQSLQVPPRPTAMDVQQAGQSFTFTATFDAPPGEGMPALRFGAAGQLPGQVSFLHMGNNVYVAKVDLPDGTDLAQQAYRIEWRHGGQVFHGGEVGFARSAGQVEVQADVKSAPDAYLVNGHVVEGHQLLVNARVPEAAMLGGQFTELKAMWRVVGETTYHSALADEYSISNGMRSYALSLRQTPVLEANSLVEVVLQGVRADGSVATFDMFTHGVREDDSVTPHVGLSWSAPPVDVAGPSQVVVVDGVARTATRTEDGRLVIDLSALASSSYEVHYGERLADQHTTTLQSSNTSPNGTSDLRLDVTLSATELAGIDLSKGVQLAYRPAGVPGASPQYALLSPMGGGVMRAQLAGVPVGSYDFELSYTDLTGRTVIVDRVTAGTDVSSQTIGAGNSMRVQASERGQISVQGGVPTVHAAGFSGAIDIAVAGRALLQSVQALSGEGSVSESVVDGSNVIVNTYNDLNILTGTETAGGLRQNFGVTAAGGVVKTERVSRLDADDVRTTFADVDAAGRVVRQIGEELSDPTAWDAAKVRAQTEITYDGLGRVTGKRMIGPGLPALWETFKYNSYNQVIEQHQTDDGVVHTKTNVHGEVLFVSTARDEQLGTTYRRDSKGRVTQEVDAVGNVTQYQYDLFNRVIAVTDPRGYALQHGHAGTTPEDQELEAMYVEQRRALGVVYTQEWLDALSLKLGGQLGPMRTLGAGALGVDITSDVDPQYNQHMAVLSQAYTRRFTYDQRGLKTSEVSPLLFHLLNDDSLIYAARREVGFGGQGWSNVSFRLPLEASEIPAYLAANPDVLPALTDLFTKHFVYDGRGNLVKEVQAGVEVSAQEYDGRGQVWWSSGKTKVFDDAGRLKEELNELGLRKVYDYDEFGRLASLTDEDRFTIKYTYDGFDRVIRQYSETAAERQYDDQLEDPQNKDVRFAYDGDRVVQIENRATGVYTSYRYSLDGLRIGETVWVCPNYADGFDSNGVPKLPEGMPPLQPVRKITLSYDVRRRLERVADEVTGAHINYRYDADNNRTWVYTDARADNEGQAPTIYTNWDPDRTNNLNTDFRLVDHRYRFDAANRLIEQRNSSVDAQGQVSDEAVQGIAYDNAGNRWKFLALDGTLHRYVAWGDDGGVGAEFGVDAEGQVMAEDRLVKEEQILLRHAFDQFGNEIYASRQGTDIEVTRTSYRTDVAYRVHQADEEGKWRNAEWVEGSDRYYDAAGRLEGIDSHTDDGIFRHVRYYLLNDGRLERTQVDGTQEVSATRYQYQYYDADKIGNYSFTDKTDHTQLFRAYTKQVIDNEGRALSSESKDGTDEVILDKTTRDYLYANGAPIAEWGFDQPTDEGEAPKPVLLMDSNGQDRRYNAVNQAAGGSMRTYEVQQGDSWASMALRHYGSPQKAYLLMNANPGYAPNSPPPAGAVITVPPDRQVGRIMDLSQALYSDPANGLGMPNLPSLLDPCKTQAVIISTIVAAAVMTVATMGAAAPVAGAGAVAVAAGMGAATALTTSAVQTVAEAGVGRKISLTGEELAKRIALGAIGGAVGGAGAAAGAAFGGVAGAVAAGTVNFGWGLASRAINGQPINGAAVVSSLLDGIGAAGGVLAGAGYKNLGEALYKDLGEALRIGDSVGSYALSLFSSDSPEGRTGATLQFVADMLPAAGWGSGHEDGGQSTFGAALRTAGIGVSGGSPSAVGGGVGQMVATMMRPSTGDTELLRAKRREAGRREALAHDVERWSQIGQQASANTLAMLNDIDPSGLAPEQIYGLLNTKKRWQTREAGEAATYGGVSYFDNLEMDNFGYLGQVRNYIDEQRGNVVAGFDDPFAVALYVETNGDLGAAVAAENWHRRDQWDTRQAHIAAQQRDLQRANRIYSETDAGKQDLGFSWVAKNWVNAAEFIRKNFKDLGFGNYSPRYGTDVVGLAKRFVEIRTESDAKRAAFQFGLDQDAWKYGSAPMRLQQTLRDWQQNPGSAPTLPAPAVQQSVNEDGEIEITPMAIVANRPEGAERSLPGYREYYEGMLQYRRDMDWLNLEELASGAVMGLAQAVWEPILVPVDGLRSLWQLEMETNPLAKYLPDAVKPGPNMKMFSQQGQSLVDTVHHDDFASAAYLIGQQAIGFVPVVGEYINYGFMAYQAVDGLSQFDGLIRRGNYAEAGLALGNLAKLAWDGLESHAFGSFYRDLGLPTSHPAEAVGNIKRTLTSGDSPYRVPGQTDAVVRIGEATPELGLRQALGSEMTPITIPVPKFDGYNAEGMSKLLTMSFHEDLHGVKYIDPFGCFAAGTLIHMAPEPGPYDIIDETEEDDIWMMQFECGFLEARRRTYAFSEESLKVVEVRLRDERGNISTILATKEHVFQVEERGWFPARRLQAGQFMTVDGKRLQVVRARELEQQATLYDFVVDGIRHYYIGGDDILGHSYLEPTYDLCFEEVVASCNSTGYLSATWNGSAPEFTHAAHYDLDAPVKLKITLLEGELVNAASVDNRASRRQAGKEEPLARVSLKKDSTKETKGARKRREAEIKRPPSGPQQGDKPFAPPTVPGLEYQEHSRQRLEVDELRFFSAVHPSRMALNPYGEISLTAAVWEGHFPRPLPLPEGIAQSVWAMDRRPERETRA